MVASKTSYIGSKIFCGNGKIRASLSKLLESNIVTQVNTMLENHLFAMSGNNMAHIHGVDVGPDIGRNVDEHQVVEDDPIRLDADERLAHRTHQLPFGSRVWVIGRHTEQTRVERNSSRQGKLSGLL